MNRLSRITAILIQLQSKQIVTAKEIASRFNISLRTVYRDINTLQEAGVPIGSENGVGYFLVEGYSLPPISLTEEEANALIISEQFIKKQGDTSLSENFQSLSLKIKSVLKNFQKDTIELLENRTHNFVKEEPVKSSWLSEIQKAIARSVTLEITYHSGYKNEITHRSIHPLGIYFTNNTWVLIADCQTRKSLREFRLDRIKQLTNTNKPFDVTPGFNLKNYFENCQP